MKDIFSKCHEFLDRPKAFDAADCDLAAELFAGISPPQNAGPWMQSNGRPLLQFSSNDYLGLAMHPEVRTEAVEMVQRYGISSPMGSRLLTGTTKHHLQLESRVAAFKRCEAALTFAAGSLAMIGTMDCLACNGDLVIMDQYAHATLVCGAKSSGARVARFRHNDLDHLERLLKRSAGRRPVAIVVDGVYSMHGDMAPLPELVRLKEDYGARLIVDDAHGTGVCGENGRGTASHFGIEDQIDLQLGTFSKAVGTTGGFVAGARAVVDYIRYNAPTFVFTKAMSLAVAAATHKALRLLEKADAQRERLLKNTQRLRQGLTADGFCFGKPQSPITPIEFAGSDALHYAHRLRKEHGIWVAPVVYPAVSLGRSMIRVIPTARHTNEDIDRLTHALSRIRAAMAEGTMTAT